jgi:hypothetical protein
MTPLVTFEKSVPSGLAPRQATRDTAGTLPAWATRRSVRRFSPFNWRFVSVLGLPLFSRTGVGTLWRTTTPKPRYPSNSVNIVISRSASTP